MKILILSDIHANFTALTKLENDIDQSDAVICLGDLVGYYCQVNEVLDFVRKKKMICIQGNHDHFLINGYPDFYPVNDRVKFGIEFADRVIDPDHRKWLESLELVRSEFILSLSVILVHGSPWQPLHEYLFEDNPNILRLSEFKCNMLAFGNTHRFYLHERKQSVCINPGSVGQSRDRNTLGCACAASLDTNTFDVKRVIYEYDVSEVIKYARKNNAGEWIRKFLLE